MTVTLPKADFSWMGQLAGALGSQPQQMGAGYFPPAPSAPGAQQSGLSGTFLGRLFNQMPTNQAAINPLQQPITRLGG